MSRNVKGSAAHANQTSFAGILSARNAWREQGLLKAGGGHIPSPTEGHHYGVGDAVSFEWPSAGGTCTGVIVGVVKHHGGKGGSGDGLPDPAYAEYLVEPDAEAAGAASGPRRGGGGQPSGPLELAASALTLLSHSDDPAETDPTGRTRLGRRGLKAVETRARLAAVGKAEAVEARTFKPEVPPSPPVISYTLDEGDGWGEEGEGWDETEGGEGKGEVVKEK